MFRLERMPWNLIQKSTTELLKLSHALRSTMHQLVLHLRNMIIILMWEQLPIPILLITSAFCMEIQLPRIWYNFKLKMQTFKSKVIMKSFDFCDTQLLFVFPFLVNGWISNLEYSGTKCIMLLFINNRLVESTQLKVCFLIKHQFIL